MENHGIRLKQYILEQDLAFSQVSRRLGHGSKNTLRAWMEREELTLDMFGQLVKIFPSIMNSFPEVEWKRVTNKVEEAQEIYATSSDTQCRKMYDKLMEAHLELLKRYNDVMDKYLVAIES